VKQRITTMSSTEAEIVAVSDGLSQIVWTKNFLDALGWNVDKPLLLEQDNTGAIRSINQGRPDVQSQLKRVEVRYFTVTRYIENGFIEVVWVPTAKIVADVLTKPLQGSAFYTMRSVLLGRDFS
jgi:hypothetical protein